MSWDNKVVWQEGMFLQPHHFQQHDRYVEALVSGVAGALTPYGWGVTELSLDQDTRTDLLSMWDRARTLMTVPGRP